MLSNAYFLAKFRFDTAENEPAKKLQNFAVGRADPRPEGSVFCALQCAYDAVVHHRSLLLLQRRDGVRVRLELHEAVPL